MFPEGRMLDFLIVGVIALIVVGPKDLPILMRKVGQFVAKMRGMANEFRASFDELARQSELEELRKEVEAMRISQQSVVSQFNPLSDGQGGSVFDDIGQSLNSTPPNPSLMTAMSTPEPAAPAVVADPPPAKPVKAAKPRSAPAKPAATKSAKAPSKATSKAEPAQPAAKPSRSRSRPNTAPSDAS